MFYIFVALHIILTHLLHITHTKLLNFSYHFYFIFYYFMVLINITECSYLFTKYISVNDNNIM